MHSLTLLIMVLVAAFVVFKVLAKLPAASIYTSAGPLFTPAEVVFFRALNRAVGDQYVVFGKVRVADLVKVKGDNKSKASLVARNKIAQKHVDFVLVDRSGLNPVCAVELNDRSHQASDRKARDAFIADVFNKTNLPLVLVPASNGYDTQKLREIVEKAMHGNGAPATARTLMNVHRSDQAGLL